MGVQGRKDPVPEEGKSGIPEETSPVYLGPYRDTEICSLLKNVGVWLGRTVKTRTTHPVHIRTIEYDNVGELITPLTPDPSTA